MPRNARIDNPGLLQHVIVRGIERCDIFVTDDDRIDFVHRLTSLLKESSVVCYAWALLDNHFHLLLMPTDTTLASMMRRLLTGYAVTFNNRHKRTGHLFQNRFKSIVCDEDAYLLELIRYIHLNPVRAGKVQDMKELADYRWSGHQQLLGMGKFRILIEDDILILFSTRRSTARKNYLQFLTDGLLDDSPKLSNGGRRASLSLDSSLKDGNIHDDRILGNGLFVERVLGKVKPVEVKRSIEEIIETVSDYYGLDCNDLCWPSKVRKVAAAKAVICFVAIRYLEISGNAVGMRLNYSPSAVSRAKQRGKKIFECEQGLNDILTQMSKCQERP